MAIETERKFLVNRSLWDTTDKGKPWMIRQAYLFAGDDKTLRVRIMENQGWLCIKGKRDGLSRHEYEYAIPTEDAEQMIMHFAVSELSKLRYRVHVGGFLWEVDEFLGDNSGLVVAEIELDSESHSFEVPSWLGEEVSFDGRYSNSSLSVLPFKLW